MPDAPSVKKSETPQSPEKEKQIDRVVTAMGSEYIFLPDGRTQRYKKVEDRYYEPQDAIVFVPDWEWVKKSAPKNILKLLGENEVQYEQILLEHSQGKGKRNFIVDAKGKKLDTNEAIEAAEGPIYLTFGDENGVAFSIPVSKKPRIGWSTFDTRKFKDGDEYKRERHLGNKVTKIVEK